MINKVTKKVVKEVEEVISEEFVCDVCGRKGEYKCNAHDWEETFYFDIQTGHRDWGNDSWGSVTYTEACCTECLLKVFANWLNDDFFTHSSTAYIHIDKVRHTRGKKNEKT
jgi:hypothetical protein